MKTRDYTKLMAELTEEHHRRSPRSALVDEQAKKYLVDGGSHAYRLLQPFPPRIVAARGAWLKDEDGHDILDFWQGHMANVLGHNPELVSATLARAYETGFGLQTGFTDRLQAEVAEILCRQTGAERVRFTTSGTLANMYAVLLSCAFTGRERVIKVGGGWHGGHPWSLKGVSFDARQGRGFQHLDTEGLPTAMDEAVIVTGFNDPEQLRDDFRRHGDQVACFVVEPLLGAGGVIAATPEYLRTARELTQQYGAVLILDEVITGFRFRAGDVGALYGISPDLAVFAKVIGGGMPVAAVAGRADIMNLVGRAQGSRVGFSGGTYSAHPASLRAALTAMTYLVEHEDEVYPRLAELGENMRRTLETAFAEEGILARCTGSGSELLPGSSLAMVHFPFRSDARLDRPEDVYDTSVCDVDLGQQVLAVALLAEDVHLVHGHGGISTAHTNDEVKLLGDACRKVARRVKPYM